MDDSQSREKPGCLLVIWKVCRFAFFPAATLCLGTFQVDRRLSEKMGLGKKLGLAGLGGAGGEKPTAWIAGDPFQHWCLPPPLSPPLSPSVWAPDGSTLPPIPPCCALLGPAKSSTPALAWPQCPSVRGWCGGGHGGRVGGRVDTYGQTAPGWCHGGWFRW